MLKIFLLALTIVLYQATETVWTQETLHLYGNLMKYFEAKSSIQSLPHYYPNTGTMFNLGVNQNFWLTPLLFMNYIRSLMNLNQNVLPFPLNHDICNQQLIDDHEYRQCRYSAHQWWAYGISSSYDSDASSYQSDTKYGCCYLWALMYCTRDAVYRLCDYGALSQFYSLQNEYRDNLESYYGICYWYSHNSISCRPIFWAIIIVCLIIFLLLLLLGICLAWRFYKRRRDSKVSDSDSDTEIRTPTPRATRAKSYYNQPTNDPMPNRSSITPNNNREQETRSRSTPIDDDPNDPNTTDRYQYTQRTTAIRQISI